jgi:hypothetical protein
MARRLILIYEHSHTNVETELICGLDSELFKPVVSGFETGVFGIWGLILCEVWGIEAGEVAIWGLILCEVWGSKPVMTARQA